MSSGIVFFGLDGYFSTVLLRGLAEAGLLPDAVITSGPPMLDRRGERPRLELFHARPKLLRKAAGPDARRLVEVSLALGVDALVASDLTNPEFQNYVRARRPKALVVAGFDRLLPSAVLDLAEHGGLNVHPGRLPEERGPSPVFWALKAGKTEHHFTIHRLDAGEDTGPIVRRGRFLFPPGTHEREVHRLAATAARPALLEALRALLAGERLGEPQPKEGERCPRPKVEDCRIDPALGAEAAFIFAAGCAGSYPIHAECAGDRFYIARAIDLDPTRKLDYDFVLLGDRLLLRCQPGVVELELEPKGAVFSSDYQES